MKRKTKEKIKDNLIMFWGMLGTILIGIPYMLNDSGNITGNIILDSAQNIVKFFDIFKWFVLFLIISLMIIAVSKYERNK